MPKEYKNLLFAGTLALIAVLYSIGAVNVKLGSMSSTEGKLIPIIAGVLMFVLCVMEIASSLRSVSKGKTAAWEGGVLKSFKLDKGSRRVAATLLLICGYVVLLPSAGFILTTFGYLFLQMLTLSDERKKKAVVFLLISLFFTVSAYYLFVAGFELILPAGLVG